MYKGSALCGTSKYVYSTEAKYSSTFHVNRHVNTDTYRLMASLMFVINSTQNT